ncbi:hypothetical protein LFZ48_14135 [Salmonella enterica subsp. salamae serovar 56:z10:e,n,x str. 1369-73]|nr:hypothetical protein LFZ48_14135 [Salmonella enterica subsp. salamae serovar 56:z10:e,n,x str. 1369-73]
MVAIPTIATALIVLPEDVSPLFDTAELGSLPTPGWVDKDVCTTSMIYLLYIQNQLTKSQRQSNHLNLCRLHLRGIYGIYYLYVFFKMLLLKFDLIFGFKDYS